MLPSVTHSQCLLIGLCHKFATIPCDILSQTRRHYVTLLFIGLQVVLCSWGSGYIQLTAAAGRRRNILHFPDLRKHVTRALEWG